MSQVLVTGATGYVGREVVRQLLDAGKRVTGLARRRSNLPIDFIEADLSDTSALEKALEGRSFDCVFHLASLPGDTGDPQQMLRVNVNGCLNLLEFARKAQCGRFLLASSISAYEWYPGTKFNPPDYMPVIEDHPCRPKDIYSTTKRTQELLASTYYHQYGLATTALRLTAVVGPRGRGGGRGWRQFAEKLAGGASVQVPHFSADELCHYVDLRDVGRMFLVAAEHPASAGQIFNCVGAQPTTGHEFVQAIQRLVPDIKVEFGFPWSMAQGQQLCFDMSKAKALIGFEPKYNLFESIRSIKEWIDAGGLSEAGAESDRFATGVTQSK
jgi:UDP-glucuronate 4-epimerase